LPKKKGFTIDTEGFEKPLPNRKSSRKDATKEAADWIELTLTE
jgi:hypothetical protein